jgi:hypothetical protein
MGHDAGQREHRELSAHRQPRCTGEPCVRPAACAIRPAACAVRPAACAVRPAACAVRPAACAVRPAARVCYA